MSGIVHYFTGLVAAAHRRVLQVFCAVIPLQRGATPQLALC
jgi:hypothetical protein